MRTFEKHRSPADEFALARAELATAERFDDGSPARMRDRYRAQRRFRAALNAVRATQIPFHRQQ